MMKAGIWLAASVMLLGSDQCMAQGILGFFSQQAKKKKLMVAQVAALTIYTKQNATGYAIGKEGLHNAHTQKDEEFLAHQGYYTSLEQVNPAVSAAEKKKSLVGLQARISAAFSAEISWQQSHPGLRSDELGYLEKVADGIRLKCEADIAEMQEVITPGKLKLTDAERLDRLDRLVAAMKDKLAFTLSFTTRCRKLAGARAAERRDREQLNKLYGN